MGGRGSSSMTGSSLSPGAAPAATSAAAEVLLTAAVAGMVMPKSESELLTTTPIFTTVTTTQYGSAEPPPGSLGEEDGTFVVQEMTESGSTAPGSGTGLVAPGSGITITDFESQLGGAVYPFLEATGRAWRIVSSPVNNPAQYPSGATFGMDKPTLRWVNGSQIKDVFVDGMTTQEFLATNGLQLDMKKGGFVLSKRISRLMRPYFASGYYPDSEVMVSYMDDLDEAGKKVWDGAGLISREMLMRVMIPDGVSEAKREELLREIAHCKRVEFTLMTANGQDKGHAIVADNLPSDFVLPRDTKGEVKLINGQSFVGINFVHHHDEMRLDIQSLINLHPFFQEEQLDQWLDEEGKLFAAAVESGDVADAMSRVEHHTTMDEVQKWALREYFVSGGHPMWFADIAKNLMNQHLERLNSKTLGQMRLPVPGGRFYVMPIGVGQAAGVDHIVPRGHVRIDREHSTAWVNDEDWVALQSAQGEPTAGIASILGGADNDDALWIHGFTDHDGEAKMLCWRSPNQTGEYVVLKPTIGSYNLDWKTTEGEITYPPADSRLLPARKDKVQKHYLDLVDNRPPMGSGEYSIEVMNATIKQSIDNTGALGMYCNQLMLFQAADGRLPDELPAELEDVIDASVKTGADLSAVRQWCYEQSQMILENNKPIPAVLANRVIGATNRPVMPTDNHWLDRLTARIKTHITSFEKKRDELAKAAMPPAAIWDHAFNETDMELLHVGAGLNYVYNNATRLMRHQQGQLGPTVYDAARLKAEKYLNRYPAEQHGAILRGAIVAAYMADKPVDRVLWLTGEKTEQGHLPGMAQKTIQALREIGVLNEVGQTGLGVISYPGATVSEATYNRTIGISQVWLREAKNWQHKNGLPAVTQLNEVEPTLRAWAKDRVVELAQTDYRNLHLTVKAEGERKVAYTLDGEFFGFITKDSTRDVPEGDIIVGFSLTKDGNLRSVWRSAEEQ